MKKVLYLLTALLIGGLMLTGCKKDNPTPEPEPEPTPTTTKVAYVVSNTSSGKVMSDCFKLNVTYLDANNQEVTESGVTLPWTKVIEVTSSFHAKMTGEIVYNEEELPETVIFGKPLGIGYYSGESLVIEMTGGLVTGNRENFLNLMAQDPNRLQFTKEKDF